MKAIEIRINEENPIIAGADSLIYANLTYGYSSDEITVRGSDSLHSFVWLNTFPQKGDKVLIRIVETDKLSPVLVMEDRDKEEIKKWYERLKLELQEKGLI